jgi:hypothetical protein
MARVNNPGRVPFKLPSLQIIPAGGSVDLTNACLRECMRAISGLVAIGDLTVEWDAEDDAPEYPALPVKAGTDATPEPPAGAPEPKTAPVEEGRPDARPRAPKG